MLEVLLSKWLACSIQKIYASIRPKIACHCLFRTVLCPICSISFNWFLNVLKILYSEFIHSLPPCFFLPYKRKDHSFYLPSLIPRWGRLRISVQVPWQLENPNFRALVLSKGSDTGLLKLTFLLKRMLATWLYFVLCYKMNSVFRNKTFLMVISNENCYFFNWVTYDVQKHFYTTEMKFHKNNT